MPFPALLVRLKSNHPVCMLKQWRRKVLLLWLLIRLIRAKAGGHPRLVASPDINTEDMSAAVDFLSVQDDVDADKIGVIGICGFGGFALNVAAMDTRIKATVTSTMYDMSRVNANGYFDTMDKEGRYKLKQKLNAQRTEDFRNGTYAAEAGLPDKLTGKEPQFVKDYYDYYKTPRGYHKRSKNSNTGLEYDIFFVVYQYAHFGLQR